MNFRIGVVVEGGVSLLPAFLGRRLWLWDLLAGLSSAVNLCVGSVN